jgi:hypothetical protein
VRRSQLSVLFNLLTNVTGVPLDSTLQAELLFNNDEIRFANAQWRNLEKNLVRLKILGPSLAVTIFQIFNI